MESNFVNTIENYFAEGGWLSVILLITGAIVIGLIIGLIAFMILRNVSKISRYENLWLITQKFKASGTFLIILILLLFIAPLLDIATKLGSIYKHVLSILFILNISWILVQVVKVSKMIILQKYDIEAQDNLRAREVYTQFRILQQIITAIIIIVALAIVLMTFDRVKQIGVSILASAGLAGIIIGFAAQKSIANVIAGLQIAITQPIRIDDVVVLEGEWGRVEEITLTYVTVRIWDERRLVLPIQYFIDTPFQNWTKTSSQILGTVYLYLDYHFPVDEIRDELTRILEKSEHWDQRVNVVQVTNTNERTMEVRALVSAVDSGTAWNLRVEVREKLIKFVQEKHPEYLPRTRVYLNEKESIENEKASPENQRMPDQ